MNLRTLDQQQVQILSRLILDGKLDKISIKLSSNDYDQFIRVQGSQINNQTDNDQETIQIIFDQINIPNQETNRSIQFDSLISDDDNIHHDTIIIGDVSILLNLNDSITPSEYKFKNEKLLSCLKLQSGILQNHLQRYNVTLIFEHSSIKFLCNEFQDNKKILDELQDIEGIKREIINSENYTVESIKFDKISFKSFQQSQFMSEQLKSINNHIIINLNLTQDLKVLVVTSKKSNRRIKQLIQNSYKGLKIYFEDLSYYKPKRSKIQNKNAVYSKNNLSKLRAQYYQLYLFDKIKQLSYVKNQEFCSNDQSHKFLLIDIDTSYISLQKDKEFIHYQVGSFIKSQIKQLAYFIFRFENIQMMKSSDKTLLMEKINFLLTQAQELQIITQCIFLNNLGRVYDLNKPQIDTFNQIDIILLGKQENITCLFEKNLVQLYDSFLCQNALLIIHEGNFINQKSIKKENPEQQFIFHKLKQNPDIELKQIDNIFEIRLLKKKNLKNYSIIIIYLMNKKNKANIDYISQIQQKKYISMNLDQLFQLNTQLKNHQGEWFQIVQKNIPQVQQIQNEKIIQQQLLFKEQYIEKVNPIQQNMIINQKQTQQIQFNDKEPLEQPNNIILRLKDVLMEIFEKETSLKAPSIYQYQRGIMRVLLSEKFELIFNQMMFQQKLGDKFIFLVEDFDAIKGLKNMPKKYEFYKSFDTALKLLNQRTGQCVVICKYFSEKIQQQNEYKMQITDNNCAKPMFIIK